MAVETVCVLLACMCVIEALSRRFRDDCDGNVVDNPANVAYQEVDLPADLVRQFHRYIPNVFFSSPDAHAARSATCSSPFTSAFL